MTARNLYIKKKIQDTSKQHTYHNQETTQHKDTSNHMHIPSNHPTTTHTNNNDRKETQQNRNKTDEKQVLYKNATTRKNKNDINGREQEKVCKKTQSMSVTHNKHIEISDQDFNTHSKQDKIYTHQITTIQNTIRMYPTCKYFLNKKNAIHKLQRILRGLLSTSRKQKNTAIKQ